MRFSAAALGAGLACAAAAGAGAADDPASLPLTFAPGARPGAVIPDDFVGLSFETSHLLPDSRGRRFFTGENAQLIRLFRTVGIRNVRIGGGTVDDRTRRIPIPGPADIDPLFAFAAAADAKVIYSFRLLNGDPAQAARLARHIRDRFADRLEYFSIGNEPDWHAYHQMGGKTLDPRIVETEPDVPGSAYPSYLTDWRRFAAAIVAAAPGSRFAGPDTGSDFPLPQTKDTDFRGQSWTERFARDERASGVMPVALLHDYPGQDARGVSVAQAVDAELSRDWAEHLYPLLYDHVMARVLALGVPYRLTEANDYTGGVPGASNAFVSALWALDYLHWQALHGAVGVNFHNKRWLWTDTVFEDKTGALHLNPKAYALKAFNLGGTGRPVAVTLAGSAGANVTAYAVESDAGCLVTVINKEHGPSARAVAIRPDLAGFTGSAETMALVAPGGSLTAREGITLGGSPLTDEGAWQGRWRPADAPEWLVPPGSALIVRLSRR